MSRQQDGVRGGHPQRIGAPNISASRRYETTRAKAMEQAKRVEDQTATCIICGQPALHRYYVSWHYHIGACKAHVADAQAYVLDHRR
jgi:hypothetical protein